VDQPFADVTLVRRLVAAARPGGIVVPEVSGVRGHPVLFGREVWPELLQDGLPEGARTVVRRDASRLVHVSASDARVVMDVDTPEDASALGIRRPR
jgi:molybdenum cofactor cytidylyltransferase